MIRPAGSSRFAPGDAVRVSAREQPGHVRTPHYAEGKPGWISEILGAFPDPELLAYGGDGLPEKVLYKVGFWQRDLWDIYEGASEDILFIDLYEHWLEPAMPGRKEKP